MKMLCHSLRKNVANVLGFEHIGQVKEGFDCDLVIWKEDQIQKVITKKIGTDSLSAFIIH